MVTHAFRAWRLVNQVVNLTAPNKDTTNDTRVRSNCATALAPLHGVYRERSLVSGEKQAEYDGIKSQAHRRDGERCHATARNSPVIRPNYKYPYYSRIDHRLTLNRLLLNLLVAPYYSIHSRIRVLIQRRALTRLGRDGNFKQRTLTKGVWSFL